MVNDELKELLADYLLECDERLISVEQALLEIADIPSEDRSALLEKVRRDLHTLKGNSGMMGLTDLQSLAHRLEDVVADLDPKLPAIEPLLEGVDEFKHRLTELRAPAAADPDAATVSTDIAKEASVRIGTGDLDRLLDLATELLITRNRMASLTAEALHLNAEDPGYAEASQQAWQQLEEVRRQLEKTLTPLDSGLRRLRMVPLERLFSRLQRIVHDEAARSGKTVALVTRGGETPLDAALVEVAAETLGHLVRNAVVHGIEQPDGRRSADKPSQGTVLLEAAVRGRWVDIEVLDDGAGIDRDGLREAALARGLEMAQASDLHTLVFRPGLTIRSEVDQSSGRGVGTSAALDAVHRYGGTIDIDTAPGIGTRFLLRLPLTVAVTEALLLEVGSDRYALPISSILETTDVGEDDLLTADNETFLQRAGLNIPLIDLGSFFSATRTSRQQPRYAVLLTSEGQLRALLVDQLGDVATIVVNPLHPTLEYPPGLAGTTVLGSGEVVMILDSQSFGGASTRVAS